MAEADGSRGLFDPFSSAEAASSEAVELLLTEGGRQLYDSYIHRKSFSFASEAAAEALVAELKMCFVRCDGAEAEAEIRAEGKAEVKAEVTELSGWDLEAEPVRCPIDTWARGCVPVRRRLVRPKRMAEERKRVKRSAPVSTLSGSGGARSPRSSVAAGNGVAGVSELQESLTRSTTMKAVVRLTREDEIHDEEEVALRDMKEREARRRREEELRLQRKAAEEAEQAAKLAQMKDQMKNKPYTYDTSGNIIWIQPPLLHKLPSANPVPNFSCKNSRSDEERPEHRKSQSLERKRGRGRPKEDFTDSFQRFASQQPAMLEAMSVAPGVELSERGHAKKGGPIAPRSTGQSVPMTRREYQEMVERSEGSSVAAVGAAVAGYPDRADRGRRAQKESEAAPREAIKEGSEAPQSDVRGRVPQPAVPAPAPVPVPVPRPAPVVPMLSLRRAQMKRDALGLAMSSRERLPVAAPSRRVPGLSPRLPEEPQSERSERDKAGRIVARNPDLARRLFPR
mmetsp:Transcript_70993/g.154266  ORF Transcript_70993/g.154266 Transcript_70993/m.154266 type:complete len:510 (+) Transcript_70993:85-1614(+)